MKAGGGGGGGGILDVILQFLFHNTAFYWLTVFGPPAMLPGLQP